MKHFFLPMLLITGFIFFGSCTKSKKFTPTEENRLWFTSPAGQWEESLPLGNGRLGMMPDGGVDKERIVLNEISMWSGCEADYNNPEASSYLPAIRKLLTEGKNNEAQEMMYKHFVPKKPENGDTYGAYQVLGNLDIEYQYADKSEMSQYIRSLQLNNAVAATAFEFKNNASNQYTREYFVSRPDDVMVIRIASKQKGGVSFSFRLSRPERATVRTEGDILIMEGSLDSGKPGEKGVSFVAEASAKVKKGKITVNKDCISVSEADEAYIIVSAETDFKNTDYKTDARKHLEKASGRAYDKLKENHISAYREFYARTQLRIENPTLSANNTPTPTDERIRNLQEKDDPALAALYYNYGRYLLISSTRVGSLPPNLQGLWANACGTPWNGDYHLNINVQMNHWPVEQGNLSELHLPLIELTERLVQSGEATAKAFYGEDAEGWVAHMMTNVWNFTAPGEHPSWGATNTGGAWLCAHLWEHYLYTGDEHYLGRIYPVLKGASEFFLSSMIEEPEHGWSVTAPSSSPENAFYINNQKQPVSICMGPTMDTQLIRELYTNVIEGARILGIDADYSRRLEEAREKLPPHQISKEGYLMEWLEDYKEAEIHHRHVSHLYGLHPGNQITLTKTPELAEACRATLNRRGDDATGWSRAWKLNFWARLGDGNRAYKLFKSLLVPAYDSETPDKRRGGTFPNLFCSHPPFQIDGNWGGTSGIGEMLLQSHDGFIDFLPAIPDSWSEGSFRGFKVRGGATVDLTWREGKPQTAYITAGFANTFKVKVPEGMTQVKVSINRSRAKEYSDMNYIELELSEREKAELHFIKAKAETHDTCTPRPHPRPLSKREGSR